MFSRTLYQRSYTHATKRVQRSAFSVQRSAFSVQRSTFNVQRSAAFNVQRSAFGVQRSAYRRSTFRRSAFERSTFNVGRWALGVRRWYRRPALLLQNQAARGVRRRTANNATPDAFCCQRQFLIQHCRGMPENRFRNCLLPSPMWRARKSLDVLSVVRAPVTLGLLLLILFPAPCAK